MNSGQELARNSVEKANGAGHSLQTITLSAYTISYMNAQIALSAIEQAEVTESVSRSINQISELSEQISKDSQTSAGSSERLSQLADELKQQVAQFKLG